MSVDVPSEYEATETSSGLSVQIQGSEDYLGYGYEDYLAIFELIERGDDSLEDIANEYFNKDYGDNFSHNLSYGFYSYTTDNYGPLSLVTVDDNSTNPKFRPDTVCLQSGVQDSLSFHKSSNGGGSSGVCNAGFGILSLLVLGLALRKKNSHINFM